MIVLKVKINQDNTFGMLIFKEDLSLIEESNFTDNFEFNFYIQTWQKKMQFPKILLIIHDLKNNSVNLKLIEKQDIFI